MLTRDSGAHFNILTKASKHTEQAVVMIVGGNGSDLCNSHEESDNATTLPLLRHCTSSPVVGVKLREKRKRRHNIHSKHLQEDLDA